MTYEEVLEDIVGLREVAKALGVRAGLVDRWRQKKETNGFPDPIKKLDGLHLYSMKQMSEWFEAHKKMWPAYFQESSYDAQR